MDYFSDCETNELWHSQAQGSSPAPVLQAAALHSLIEDKEIAAEAVEIVIRSSRRGVVALCAEMAELLKAKRNLQRQVTRLSAENKALRSSSSTSSQPDFCTHSDRSGSTSGYNSRAVTEVEVHRPLPDQPTSNPDCFDFAELKATPRRRHLSVQWPLPEKEEEKKEESLLRSCSGSDLRPDSVPPQPTNASASFAGQVSLLGCACKRCFLLRRRGCPRRLLQLNVHPSNQTLRIKDVVVLRDGRRGCVRYLGHVDTDPVMDSTAIWIGIEMEDAGEAGSGGNDGKIGQKRYFSGRAGSAIFVQLPAIACVQRRSQTVYVTDFI